MAISTALSNSLKTRAIGVQILDEVFNPTAGNLPMRVALLGEPTTAVEATLDVSPYQLTSLKDCGDRYGYGSPLYAMSRILLPMFGGGVGSIPVVVYPQEFDANATATIIVLGVTATVTKTTTHTLRINGRTSVDGKSYDFTVTEGENAAAVIAKIVDVINGVLACPFSAVAGSGIVTLTTKWKGLTSAECNIEVLTNGNSAGCVYAISSTTAGTTTPNIAGALTLFGNDWNTIVVNPYSVSSVFTLLETANGTPSSVSGKYSTTVFKPFIALFGSLEDDKDDLVAITNASARKDQVTNLLCPAPLSKATSMEAAANMCVLIANIANDTPHLGVGGRSYPDMPIPADGNIGDLADVLNRNFCMQKGCSTVLIENGKYTVQDCVTTYAPDGDGNPKFAYARDLIIDWNIGYNWKIICVRDIQDRAIVANNSPVTVTGVISPKQVKSLLYGLINDAVGYAWINNAEFSKSSISIGVNGTNPVRLDISMKYYRTSTANQISTDLAVDFSTNL